MAALSSFVLSIRDRIPSAGSNSLAVVARAGAKVAPLWCAGATFCFGTDKNRRKTPAATQAANTNRGRAEKASRVRTTTDLRRSSMTIPPAASRVERGGLDFLQRT